MQPLAPSTNAEARVKSGDLGSKTVAAVTFGFWDNISNLVRCDKYKATCASKTASMRHDELANVRMHVEVAEKRLPQIVQLLNRALTALIMTAQYPCDSHDLSEDVLEKLRLHISKVGNAIFYLVDCLELRASLQVVSPLAIKELQAYTRSAQTDVEWQMLEASLSGIANVLMNFIFDFRFNNFTNIDIPPQLLALVVELCRMLDAVRPAAETQGLRSSVAFSYSVLRAAATLVLGSLASWIDPGAALASALAFVVDGITAPGQNIVDASAAALYMLAVVKPSELASTSLATFHKMYDLLPSLSSEAQENALAAVITVIVALLPDTKSVVTGLRHVFDRLVDVLVKNLAAGTPDAENAVTVLKLIRFAVVNAKARDKANQSKLKTIVASIVQTLTPTLMTVVKHYADN